MSHFRVKNATRHAEIMQPTRLRALNLVTLEALPPRGGGSAGCPKRTRGEQEGVGKIKTHRTHKSIRTTQARGTQDLPQTSRANPVQCYSTRQEKNATRHADACGIQGGEDS